VTGGGGGGGEEEAGTAATCSLFIWAAPRPRPGPLYTHVVSVRLRGGGQEGQGPRPVACGTGGPRRAWFVPPPTNPSRSQPGKRARARCRAHVGFVGRRARAGLAHAVRPSSWRRACESLGDSANRALASARLKKNLENRSFFFISTYYTPKKNEVENFFRSNFLLGERTFTATAYARPPPKPSATSASLREKSLPHRRTPPPLRLRHPRRRPSTCAGVPAHNREGAAVAGSSAPGIRRR
jgi:hypothetical protein